MKRKYEVIVTFDPDVNEEGVNAQLAKLREMITSFDGQVINEENTGRQALAYPMNKKTHGTYVILVVECKPEFVAEFTRQMRINDTVLRFMASIRDDRCANVITKAEERSARPGGRDSRDNRGPGGRDNKFSKDRKRSDSDTRSSDTKKDAPKSEAKKDASKDAPKAEVPVAAKEDKKSSAAEEVTAS